MIEYFENIEDPDYPEEFYTTEYPFFDSYVDNTEYLTHLFYKNNINESLHLIETSNNEFQYFVSQLSKDLKYKNFSNYDMFKNHAYSFCMHIKSGEHNLLWLDSLYLYINYYTPISCPNSNGASLFDSNPTKTDFYKDTKDKVEKASIELNISDRFSVNKIERIILHEIKHIYTHFVERIKSLHKDLAFIRNYSKGYKTINIGVTYSCQESDISTIKHSQNNIQIAISLIHKLMYFINYEEIRSKLENVNKELQGALCIEKIQDFRNKLKQEKLSYYFKKSDTNKIYHWIYTFCNMTKNDSFICNIVNKYILPYLNKEKIYNKQFKTPIDFLNFIRSKSEEFLKKSSKIYVSILNEIISKTDNFNHKIKLHFFFDNQSHCFKPIAKVGKKHIKYEKLLDKYYEQFRYVGELQEVTLKTMMDKFSTIFNVNLSN